MQIKKRAAVLASTMLLLGSLGALQAPTASAAVICTTQNAITAKSTTLDGVHIELRYSTSWRCAWARITNAHVGDQVWLDQSADSGKNWATMEVNTVTSGTDAFTNPDPDKGIVSRACVWIRSSNHHKCTGAY
ncbi:DUF2690 domain-containing protein [Streptomyces sp. NPDC059443]|uniref:DUF2690 domain-containing protein n=1 Tax=unclassified Streptomyces TaxID=2593676 RepID=UPI0036BD792B